jgi:1-pyrroline-5-carboxylate dehydrogenase
MTLADLKPFRNEPFTDFTTAENKRAMQEAIQTARSAMEQTYELNIGGQPVRTATKFHSVNPARPAEIVGTHFEAGPAEAQAAVKAAQAAFATWHQQPVSVRAGLLLKAASLIRERHFDFCAWLTLEVGKNFAEADADVGECIDFLEFYAREALRLAEATTPIQLPGEKNLLRYVPLGVGAVIPPWNFPFAIMAGMTCAAIVTGNTVVLKPSPDAPTIAARFLELMIEAGLPDGVINLVQGGAELGRAITEHPEIRFIAFTGSKKVGLEIHANAAKTLPGQKFIRRTILELGGKDAIIVEADCDIDGHAPDGGHALDGGFFIAPTIIADIEPDSRLAQEEVFGPLLAVIRSSGFDDALAIANSTDYGLTGALYTSSRTKLDRARDEFHVGNLYFNRKCTGAMVGAHPFGGFNLSGTDSKAGGPDYLLLFTQGKSVAEKLGVISGHDEEQEQRMGV